jgi:hypothetical protein
MQLTVSSDDRVLQVEVDAHDPVENIKAIIEAEVLHIPLSLSIVITCTL